MEPGTLLVFGLVMMVGLVGVVVPVIPGLLLIGVAAIAWAWLEDGTVPWIVAAVMILVLVLGTVAKYILPSRSLKEAGAPRSTLLLGALGAVVGFFVIPVVGFLVGAVAGVWIGELRRLGDSSAAWRSTWVTAKAIGVGMLLELAAGVIAVLIWAVGALAVLG